MSRLQRGKTALLTNLSHPKPELLTSESKDNKANGKGWLLFVSFATYCNCTLMSNENGLLCCFKEEGMYSAQLVSFYFHLLMPIVKTWYDVFVFSVIVQSVVIIVKSVHNL